MGDYGGLWVRRGAGVIIFAFSQNAHKPTNVDDYGFRWVKWDAWARAQGQTTEKEVQMVVSRLFWQGHRGKKKTGTWQGWLG